MSLVIGCDVGTQSTKGVLMAPDGEVVASASSSYEVDFPGPGRAEQDPRDWIVAVERVFRRLTESASEPIEAIGVAAQVDGVVALDQRDQAVHPALIWMDRRATSETAALKEGLGADRIFELTGLNCDASHIAPKIMWLRNNLDERQSRYECPAQFVVRWLTGASAQDPANASSSMLYDIAQGRWSDVMADATKIDPDSLGTVSDAQEVVGQLTRDLTSALGFSKPPAVVVGTGDDHSAAVGSRATSPGVLADITGTAEPIGTSSPEPVFDPERLLETHRHAIPGSFFVENPGFVSGGSVLWASSVLGLSQSRVLELAADAPPGSKGLVFIPALSGAVAPRWSEKHRGSYVGLSMDHGVAELCRAILEGCAFALRDNVEAFREIGLPISRTHVSGGGSRSDLWLQIKADVTGLPMVAVEGESAAIGAACLASVAAGWFEDAVEASDRLASTSRMAVAPDPGNSDVYEHAYGLYRRTFDALDPVYRQ